MGVSITKMFMGGVVPAVQLLYKLPDELTFTHAALVEPLTIGLHGATRARVSKGEHCVVFGAGIIGLMAAFACINYGATPILVDVLQKRLDYAKELGVPCTFNSTDKHVEEYLREVTAAFLRKEEQALHRIAERARAENT